MAVGWLVRRLVIDSPVALKLRVFCRFPTRAFRAPSAQSAWLAPAEDLGREELIIAWEVPDFLRVFKIIFPLTSIFLFLFSYECIFQLLLQRLRLNDLRPLSRFWS